MTRAAERANRQRDATAAWSAMRRLVLDQHDRRAEVAERLQLSFIRAKALLRLARGPLTMRELAAGISTDAPYTTVVVDDLERRGLVRRSSSPDDRRVKLVSLTAAGAESADIAERILGEPPAVLARLSAEEVATLARILRVLAEDA